MFFGQLVLRLDGNLGIDNRFGTDDNRFVTATSYHVAYFCVFCHLAASAVKTKRRSAPVQQIVQAKAKPAGRQHHLSTVDYVRKRKLTAISIQCHRFLRSSSTNRCGSTCTLAPNKSQ